MRRTTSAQRNIKMNKLYKFKKKRVTLEELLSVGISEDEILSFVAEGRLVPMKSSGTNGNLRKTKPS